MITEVASILRVCGIGSYLQIGDGRNSAVFNLLKQSLDAYGTDPSPEVVTKNLERAPGRFFEGTLLNIPFKPQAFDTVIVGSELISLSEEHFPKVLSTLYQLTKKNLVLLLPMDSIRILAGHKKSNRLFWERIAIEAGFRRHPRSMMVESYMNLENEHVGQLTFFERVPEIAREAHRNQPDDMLRKSGRRADATIWRYVLSSTRIHPGDTVLDVMCGPGYGTSILSACSPGAKFIGVDNNPDCVAYAKENYGNSFVSYHTDDISNLSSIPEHSIDVVIAFDTLARVKDYESFLKEVLRILKPDGRMIGSIPNLWCDETGMDPDITHFHVFDWEKLRREVGKYFMIDGRWAQIAGGGFKLPQGKREIAAVDLDYFAPLDAEWWIFSAKVDPRKSASIPYSNPFYRHTETLPTQIDFGKYYDNPWIFRVMVEQGIRLIDENVLKEYCALIVKESKPGSPDHGAALCVLAYRLLESANVSLKAVILLAQHINQFDAHYDRNNPHSLRWAISLHYVAGRLLAAIGNRDDALASFLTCAEMDPVPLTPILGTKTIGARLFAGLILVGNGDLEGARKQFRLGIQDTHRIMQGDWKNIIGDFEKPLAFALPEAAEVLNIASQCACALNALDKQKSVPGFFWDRINVKFFGYLDWNRALEQENHILRQKLQHAHA